MINPIIKNKEIIKNVNNNLTSIIELNDIELNILPFDLALKKDKRTYLIYYISLLMTKHNFLFIFNNVDYNAKIIKIDLLFLSLSIYFTVNALFFNDNTIHKIYEDKGVFNFIYQLPQIIYSSLISTVLNICLKNLGLSSDTIIKFKQEKNDKTTDKMTDLYYKLKIKFILFFTLGFIFLISFWLYLSVFGIIYKNTQLHLIKDTLISFGLSLLYPFGIYLLPGFFRIPALARGEKKREYLYNFSKLLQTI